ncbi:hypothetical protein WJX73_004610 [Symbiochloris irregularis]|uniref:RAP domain-containing protein n=1 Tax=Symbiochloris irregularis TaxID=706552 RepID=A0AAW1PUX1_9CHLO
MDLHASRADPNAETGPASCCILRRLTSPSTLGAPIGHQWEGVSAGGRTAASRRAIRQNAFPDPGVSCQGRFASPLEDGSSSSSGRTRRAPMEINHNKAITKKLASAVHYQQVLDVVAESVNVFDEVNVATALHRLAKLQPHNPGAQPSPVIYADHFQQLVLAIKRQLHRFEAQAVSNTLWAFATLAYYPDDEVLDRLADHAATIIHTFRPQATSNTLWAFAKLAYTPCKALLEAAAQQIVCDLSKSVPQDISNTIWAYATLRHHPGQELMKGAAHQAAILMPRFKPQEIANTLWSYATLGHDPGSSLLDSIAGQMSDRIQHFRPQAVSNSLWAYAKLGYNPGSRLLDVTAHRATSMLHQYTSQEIANTLWALSTLEHHPGSRLLDAAAVQIARRVEQFSPQDTTNSMYGFAKLFHHPCNNLPGIVALYALRHWHRFKGSELANLLWSLSLLKAVPLDTWQALLTKLAQTPLENFDNADLHQLYQTYLLLDSASEACEHMGVQPLTRGFTDEMVEAIKGAWRLGVQRDGQLATLHEQVSRVLWRMGVVHRNQHILFDGMVCVDIVLEGDTIVLEVDEASHFAVNTWRPLGRTIARRCMLEAWGLVVRSIPFYEWSALQGLEQQKAYLGRLLSSVAVLSSTLGSPAPSTTPSS